MKNFFIPKAGMPEGAQQTLSVYSEAVELNLDGVFGWVVEETQLEEIMKILGAEKNAEKETSLEGIFQVALNFNVESSTEEVYSRKLGEVKILSWDGQGQDRFKKTLTEILLPALQGKGVEVSVPHKKVVQPRETSDFQIFIWSSRSGSATLVPPQKIWGQEVACRDNSFSPTGEGVSFEDNLTGYSVGELIANTLYVHHDLVHEGCESELKIFRHLLQEVVAELTLSTAEKVEREAKRAEEAAKRNREAYILECHKRFEKTLNGTKDAIKQGHDRIAQLQQELVRAIRETQGKELKLEQLQSAQCDQIERYGVEYDRLLTVKKVKSVRISDGEVKVFTDTLFCTDPRSDLCHEIGAFEIRIPTNGSGGVRWFNLTRRVDGYKDQQSAPHIWSDGSACLGNTQEIFPELIASYEFATVAMVAIQFVESVNTDDSAGKHIDRWPVKE